MLIASWNVNSIRIRLPQVIEWIKKNKPDVLCLQETKVLDKDFPYTDFEALDYRVKTYGQKSYNGVAIISNFEIKDLKLGFESEGNINDKNLFTQLNEQKRIMSASINGIRIINVYVPNGSSLNSEKFIYKINWLKALNLHLKNQNIETPQCLLGDFNIALDDKDIHDPQKYQEQIMASQLEREKLNNLLYDNFIDSFRVFEKKSGFWSWWDYRNNAYEFNKGWRIDHIYISTNLLPKLKSSVIDRSQRENEQPSDHAPVMIDLDMKESFFDSYDEDDDLFEI